MKNQVFTCALLTFLGSCASQTPVYRGLDGLPTIECAPPNLIAVRRGYTSRMFRDQIRDAIAHWNTSIGFTIFTWIGELSQCDIDPETPITWIYEHSDLYNDDKKRICGNAGIYPRRFRPIRQPYHCVRFSHVKINAGCGPGDKLQTVLRHELGHVIGLGHTTDQLKLMHHRIYWGATHPVAVDANTIETVREIYSVVETGGN